MTQVMCIVDVLGDAAIVTICGTETEPLFATKVELFCWCPFEVTASTVRVSTQKNTPKGKDPWRVSEVEGFEILEGWR